MIEGQEGVTWEQWQALAHACQEHGLFGLFRSDHYGTVHGGAGSLDAWATLAALGPLTERIRLGTLVSPVTFRHPSVLAKSVVTADHASGGRMELGMGAGWNPNEHVAYGFPFPDTGTRMEMLGEQLEIVHQSWDKESFSFQGAHYQLEDCSAEFKPLQRPHPRLIVGGTGGAKTIDLAARWADEYNMFGKEPDDFRRVRPMLDAACGRYGRDPGEVRMTAMNRIESFLVGAPDGWTAADTGRAVERFRAYADARVERAYLQHLAHNDLEMVAVVGRQVLPALA